MSVEMDDLQESVIVFIVSAGINSLVLIGISLTIYFKWYEISFNLTNVLLCKWCCAICGIGNQNKKEDNEFNEYKYNPLKVKENHVFVDKYSNLHFLNKFDNIQTRYNHNNHLAIELESGH